MGNLRVTGGVFKGRRIKVPAGHGVRPTPARVREALFSILGEEVEGSVVLDLFAGSGSLGIEALSRGAKKVVFVEKDWGNSMVLVENLRSLGVDDERWDIFRQDVRSFIRTAERKGYEFDVIFMDPPYRSDLGEQSLILLDRSNLVKIGGIVVCESPRGKPQVELEMFVLHRQKRYGDTEIFIFRRREEFR